MKLETSCITAEARELIAAALYYYADTAGSPIYASEVEPALQLVELFRSDLAAFSVVTINVNPVD